jgi:YbbR domain-containing protein
VKLFPGILARNWQLKLSAFGLAVLLWTVPRFEAPSRQELEAVPVRVQLRDPRWTLRDGYPLPSSVNVTLSGPAREVFSLAVEQPSIVIQVDQVANPDTAVLLRPSWLNIPEGEGVVVESLEPGYVELSFERMDVAAVPLAARLVGTPPDSLALAERPSLSDSLVRVSGAESRIRSLQTIFLVPLDLSEVEASGSFARPVDTTGLEGMALSLSEATVGIRLEGSSERVLADLPVEVPPMGTDPQIQARPTLVSVTLSGARSLVETVSPDQLRITISSGRALALSPGEERNVPVVVEGLPELVQATASPAWVTLRRPVGS